MIPITSWLLHVLETRSALLTLCAGNKSVTGGFSHKGLMVGNFDASFVVSLTSCCKKLCYPVTWCSRDITAMDVPNKRLMVIYNWWCTSEILVLWIASRGALFDTYSVPKLHSTHWGREKMETILNTFSNVWQLKFFVIRWNDTDVCSHKK